MPKRLILDANIIYLLWYDIEPLRRAGGTYPRHYQTEHYPKWWKKAIGNKTEAYTSTATMLEVAHVIERMEMELLWRTDPDRRELDRDHPGADFSPKYVKDLRRFYADQMVSVRQASQTYLDSISRIVSLMPEDRNSKILVQKTVAEWLTSLADVSDACLISHAKRIGQVHVLSDDADLVTFGGITVYTANRNTIDAARQASRLV